MSDVLDQADALMRRHRSFVARTTEPAEPSPPPVIEDDIPVLTEVVAEISPVDSDPTPVPDRELEEALSTWLATVLPAALDHASNALTTELAERARQELLPKLLEITKNGTRQKL